MHVEVKGSCQANINLTAKKVTLDLITCNFSLLKAIFMFVRKMEDDIQIQSKYASLISGLPCLYPVPDVIDPRLHRGLKSLVSQSDQAGIWLPPKLVMKSLI